MTPMAPMAPVPPMMPPTQQPPPMASATPQAAAPELPMFVCPRRPNLGREGRPIMLRANHFQISMPRGYIHHYDISIQPDKCPRKVNRYEIHPRSRYLLIYVLFTSRSNFILFCYVFFFREIIETMVHAYSKIFGALKPVFDGRSNLYTRDPLPIGNERVELDVTLPGEGKDRVFHVAIKWLAKVSLYALEEALEGMLIYPMIENGHF